MKRITEPLKRKVIEIGMLVLLIYDIDDTNSRHLGITAPWLHSARFPMAHCLSSTAKVVDLRKRKNQLFESGSRCLRGKYGVNPEFIHTDEDMRHGWQQRMYGKPRFLWWWHLRRAVRTRLAKTKLATSLHIISAAQWPSTISSNPTRMAKFVDGGVAENEKEDASVPFYPPPLCREATVNTMERHCCAYQLILGFLQNLNQSKGAVQCERPEVFGRTGIAQGGSFGLDQLIKSYRSWRLGWHWRASKLL